MSLQSEAAKAHVKSLLEFWYGPVEVHRPTKQKDLNGTLPQEDIKAFMEYRFCPERKWRLDYAVPSVLCANVFWPRFTTSPSFYRPLHSILEIHRGNFIRGAHANPAALRDGYEKLNAAAELGWRVWQFMPEQIIKSGRKTLPDEPVLLELPWIN